MERSRNALMDVITRGPIALENVHQQSCQGVNGGTGNCVNCTYKAGLIPTFNGKGRFSSALGQKEYHFAYCCPENRMLSRGEECQATRVCQVFDTNT